MKTKLEKKERVQPKADPNKVMKFYFANDYAGVKYHAFWNAPLIGPDPTEINHVTNYTESVEDELYRAIGEIGEIERVQLWVPHTGETDEAISRFEITGLGGSASDDVTMECNGIVTENTGLYLMSDIYSPNTLWNGTAWYNTRFKNIYVDATELKSETSDLTDIGYQVKVDGQGVIGFGGSGRCVSVLNAISFYAKDTYTELILHLKSENGLDQLITTKIVDQNGITIWADVNRNILASAGFQVITLPTNLDVLNNCYTIKIEKGSVHRKYTFPTSTQSDGDNDMSHWNVHPSSYQDFVDAPPTQITLDYTLQSSNDDNNNDWCHMYLYKRNAAGQEDYIYNKRKDGLENQFHETVTINYTPEYGDTFYIRLTGGHQGTGTSNIGLVGATLDLAVKV